MTPSSATGLGEKALEAANAAFSEAHNVPQQCYDCAGTGRHSDESTCRTCEGNGWVAPKGWDPMASAIRAYMSALTVTSFPPAEQHDVTSHAVPLGYASPKTVEALLTNNSVGCFISKTREHGFTQPLFTHPAPVAAQPADDVQALLETLDGGVQATGGQSEDGTELFHVEDASEAMVDAARLIRKLLASSPTPPTAPAVPAGVREAAELRTMLTNWREHYSLSTQEKRMFDRIDDALSALPAQPNSERQKALDAAADLIDGWTTATNTRHLQGWGVHTNAVADMLAKRDAEIATAIRALATNPPNSSEGEPT